jgi:hypothetical protein
MTAELSYTIMRNFCVLTAMLLIIRNVAWCGEMFRVYIAGGDTDALFYKKHITDEWVVRAGSVLIALAALFALIIATLEHVVHWLHPTPYTIPAAFMSLVCIETLMVWRLIYFAPKKNFMAASIACLFALSFVIEAAR